LKAVENPNKGEITQGVMVTPEGGYVVAQPDLWVFDSFYDGMHFNSTAGLLGRNNYPVRRV
jgi:hypothetical protein